MKQKMILDPLTGTLHSTADTDSLDSRITTLENKYVITTRFAEISAGTSGSVSLPANSTVRLDDFGGTVDAIVAQMSGGKPTSDNAYTSSGSVITTTFDASGNYVLSGTPSSYPVAIIYRVTTKLVDFNSSDSSIVGDVELIPNHDYLDGISGGLSQNNAHYAIFATTTAAKAAAPTQFTLAYIEDKEAIYQYCSDCSYPADDDLVLITGNGGNTRWELVQKMSRTQGDTGWINTDNATISALSSTQMRLAISSTAAIAIKGKRIPVPVGSYDVTLTGVGGPKFIGFNDETLTLTAQDSLWNFNTQVPVAICYWSGTAIVAAPQTEFHGIRDTVWHSWAHKFLGLQYVSGLGFTGNVQTDNNTNPGANDTVFYLWSTSGVIQDEDVQSTPGTGQWAQTLGSGLASTTAGVFNFFYFDGTVITTAAAMADRAPFLHAGANTPPQWNNNGSLTAAITGDYIVYHYFASPMIGGWSVFARPHNAKFTSLANALAANPTQLVWTNYAELKHIYTAVFRVNTGWSNTHLCKLVALRDFRTVAGTPVAAMNPTAHSSLSGLELAQTGATYGHIDDQPQTIAGAKTWTGKQTFDGGAAIKGATSAVAAGYIGEDLSIAETTGVSINTSTYTNVVSKTLTAGVWLVSGGVASPGTTSQTALQSRFVTKGSTGTLIGKDVIETAIQSGYPYSTATVFPARIVVIESGDSNKNVGIEAATAGANSTGRGWLSVVRIA